jgi:hypothetical protein
MNIGKRRGGILGGNIGKGDEEEEWDGWEGRNGMLGKDKRIEDVFPTETGEGGKI